MDSLASRLVDFVRPLAALPPEELTAETPLFESGALDSLGLLQLAVQIEQEVGHSLDPSTFDMWQEWRTIDAIVAFVHAHRR